MIQLYQNNCSLITIDSKLSLSSYYNLYLEKNRIVYMLFYKVFQNIIICHNIRYIIIINNNINLPYFLTKNLLLT